MKKVRPEFCPFRIYLRVQHNIADIFERFFYLFMQQKNEDTGNLQQKLLPYECATCDKRFPYLYSFKDCQRCISVMNEKSLTWILSLKNLFEGATSYLWHLCKVFYQFMQQRRRRKPSRKIQTIWMCHVWQKISLSLLLWRLVLSCYCLLARFMFLLSA